MLFVVSLLTQAVYDAHRLEFYHIFITAIPLSSPKVQNPLEL